MKKPDVLKLLAVFALIFSLSNSYAQCAINFSYTQNANGYITFTALATPTTQYYNQYSWNFGGGTGYSTATVNLASATYTANGTYTITLTGYGTCTATVQQTIAITNVCTPPAFTTSVGLSGYVTFSNTSTPGAFSGYTVDWGDGTQDGPNPHQYASLSSHNITLYGTTTSTPSCIGSFSQNVNAGCAVPVFSVTQNLNGNVTLTNITSTNAATTYTVIWGDGVSNPTGLSFSHQYTLNAVYTATIMASSVSCYNIVTQTINISNCTPCSSSFTYSATGDVVSFNSTSTGTTGTSSYNWDFGDSTTGTGSAPTHTYSANGFYTVTLNVADPTNSVYCSSQQGISVYSGPTLTCNLVAGYSYSSGATGIVSFNSTSTGTATGAAYNWNFGDGQTGIGNPVSHYYYSAGNYNVSLIVSDFCSDTFVQVVTAISPTCVADPGFNISPTGTPHSYDIIPDFPWNISDALWSWGDGSTSSTLYSSHTYSAAGNYSICLTVTASCGSTATACNSYSISRTAQLNDIIHVDVVAPGSITGIATTQANKLDYTIYPNPSNGSFSLKMSAPVTGKVNVSVYTLVGSKIYESEHEASGGTVIRDINPDNAVNGVYFIKVTAENKTYTEKLIINK